ncbi:glycosyltransferase family 2 protein [Pseudomonas knackmussii]|uniref:glycosyltransferase family 2 protein n=1 Tax=Pseudomonas knackmussii TaxID=65741 RepID=UPI003F4A8408
MKISISNPSAEKNAPSTQRSQTSVAILLSTFQGEDFLVEQLESIRVQTHENWVIYASDDGSSDSTRAILQRYATQLGAERLIIFDGPRRGFAANFLSLIRKSPDDAGFFAFCDQDDLWAPDKLERALGWASQAPSDVPALYCSRTQLVDREGVHIGLSPLFDKRPSFANALVQSLAGGNTMVFNGAAKRLLAMTPRDSNIIAHDWWAYILVSGCGGRVFYDPSPHTGYRQHGKNLIGSNSSLRDRFVRFRRMLAGTFRGWNDENLKAISPLRHLLTEESQATLQLFEHARRASLPRRLYLIGKSGIYRQTLPGNLGLVAAAILQRL